MIAISITNIANQKQADGMVKIFKKVFSALKISFDIERPTLNYPYQHSILRVERDVISTKSITALVHKSKHSYDSLEDKVCT